MYQAFDRYLSRETWHTRHANDDEEFYDALATVVDSPDFSPEKMGEYMRTQKNVPPKDHEDAFALAIAHRVTEAWAIRDFLRRTRR